MYKNEVGILKRASCTGFFWRDAGVPYLVTNRHCVTGKDHLNEIVATHGFEPTHIQIYFYERGKAITEGVTMYYPKAVEVSLFSDGEPEWFEHPSGTTVDVIAIALDSPSILSVDCVNDRKFYDEWKPEAGSDCFIVGYPEGVSGSDGTPIWKRASIATEPELDYKQLPIFLCDSATRPGLSGGPVFGKAYGFFDQKHRRIDPYQDGIVFLGHWPVFLGVYAGREGLEADGFQLCRIWKKAVLTDLISNKKKAASPFVRIAPGA
jgi:hypothetical protein